MRIAQMGTIVALAVGMVAADAWSSRAEDQLQEPPHHILMTPADLTWQDGPSGLPAGSQFVVVEGDPSQPGPFTMRGKVPANYRIPAHWHPADEHVTVLSGTLYMGMGDTLDTTQGKALSAGSFALMPAQAHHFAWTTEETILQVHGVGPWGITYVNPADDPRKQE